MKINKLKLKNFRGFQEITIDFQPHFNIIIGDNGCGKTAVLEGLSIAAASFFLGIDGINSRNIQSDDCRLVNYKEHIEPQFPVQVECWGAIACESLVWLRERKGSNNKTTIVKAKNIKALAQKIQDEIRAGKNINLPVIAYYFTNRLWINGKESGFVAKGSRFRGYYNGLNPTSNNILFTQWFKSKELMALQLGTEPVELKVVRNAVSCCISECQKLYFDLNEGVLMMAFKDGRILPFKQLSDGIKNLLAMVADIAFRCTSLNPHLGKKAAYDSEGVILIDELDLHLHPAKQQKVIFDLKTTFPKIQFITTTHSPLTLSTVADSVITLKDNQAYRTEHTYGRDVNNVLRLAMETLPRCESVQKELDNYLTLIEEGKGKSEEAVALRKTLEADLGIEEPELIKADVLINFVE
jgi:predicted ATP-binding protein involved in virulence